MEGTVRGVRKGELKARSYWINPGAIGICNLKGLEPSECIMWLAGEIAGLEAERERVVLKAVRRVVQEEGVVLNEMQKGFFRDLAVGMVKHLKGEI